MLFGTSDNNKRSNDLVDPRLDNVFSHTDSPQRIPQCSPFLRSCSSTIYSTVNPSAGLASTEAMSRAQRAAQDDLFAALLYEHPLAC
jgi:hypothetical protein